MKKLIFISLLFLAAFHSYGQSVVPLRGDKIRIYKNGGSAELQLQNATRDTIGPLINTGDGNAIWAAPHRVNDSTIVIGPITIITQGPGSPPQTGSGDTIYIAAAVDTVYLFNIGNLAPAQRTIYAVDGNLRASNWGNGLFTFIRMAADSSLYEDLDTAGLRAYLNIAVNGLISITADNGLTASTPTNVELGGDLIKSTVINADLYQLTLVGSASSTQPWVMEIQPSSTGAGLEVLRNTGTGPGIVVENAGGGTAIYGISESIGVYGVSTGPASAALLGSTSGGASGASKSAALLLNAQDGGNLLIDGGYQGLNNNTVDQTVRLIRSVEGGVGADGEGQYIDFWTEADDGLVYTTNQIVSKWTTAAVASRFSEFDILGTQNGITSIQVGLDQNALVSYTTIYGFITTSSEFGIFSLATNSAGTFTSPGTPLFVEGTDGVSEIQHAITIARGAGTPTAGLGASIFYRFNNDTGHEVDAGAIINQWTSAVTTAEKSEFIFETIDSGLPVDGFIIKSYGTYNTPFLISYANNAAALAGGLLIAGDHYRCGDGDCVVHP